MNDNDTPENGTLDLTPPENGIIYHLLRLGLAWDHSDPDHETWCDYTNRVRADYTSPDATQITISDMDSHISKTLTIDELRNTTDIITWKRKNTEQ